MKTNTTNKMDKTGGNEKVGEGVGYKTMGTEVFVEAIRGEIREAIMRIMEREVELLCGAAYDPKGGENERRAGSEKGRYYWEGKAYEVIRPRVRKGEKEVKLASYKMARSREREAVDILRMVEGGMSMKGIGRLKRPGFSASVAQKVWEEESTKGLEELRSRDLKGEQILGIMVDGVYLAKEVVVVVAIGFCTDGTKKVLDFTVGSTESYEVCKGLMKRMIDRGFASCTAEMLAVIDGGDGLRKAIVEMFPEAKVQRCWVHKERNLYGYLRKVDHEECKRLLARMRKAEGKVAGEEAFKELEGFLKGKNQQAYASLKEGEEDLLRFHRLDVPGTLNRHFLSTNAIENVMRSFRRQTDRVSQWRQTGKQIERWAGAALKWAEEGFRKIVGHAAIPELILALGGMRAAGAPEGVPGEANPPGSSTPSTPSGAQEK